MKIKRQALSVAIVCLINNPIIGADMYTHGVDTLAHFSNAFSRLAMFPVNRGLPRRN